MEERSFWLARLLVLGIVVSMTRAFAVTNLFEFVLTCLVIWCPNLRASVFRTLVDPRILLTLVFLSWVGLSSTWSEVAYQARIEDVVSWRKLLLVPICFALFKETKHKRILKNTFVITCVGYLILSYCGYFGWITLDRDPSGVLENNSTQGIMFAAAGFFIALTLPLKRQLWVKASLMVLILAFFANILLLSQGRSGYLFVVVCVLGLVHFYSKKVILSRMLIFGALIIGVLIANQNSRDRIIQGVSEAIYAFEEQPKVTSIGIRVVMWSNTLDIITANPILGTGAGSFKSHYERLVDGVSGWRGTITDDPHQQYLHIAAEYGIIGLLLFISCLLAWYSSDYKGEMSEMKIYRIAAFTFLSGIVVTSFANGHFSTFVEGRFVWVFISVLLAGTSINSIKLNSFCAKFQQRLHSMV